MRWWLKRGVCPVDDYLEVLKNKICHHPVCLGESLVRC